MPGPLYFVLCFFLCLCAQNSSGSVIRTQKKTSNISSSVLVEGGHVRNEVEHKNVSQYMLLADGSSQQLVDFGSANKAVIAVQPCGNGVPSSSCKVSYSKAACKGGNTEQMLLDGKRQHSGAEACDCTAGRNDLPCCDRMHIYKHPTKVASGKMFVFHNTPSGSKSCDTAEANYGFSEDGEKWTVAKSKTGWKKSPLEFDPGDAMPHWQYFYLGWGCGWAVIYEMECSNCKGPTTTTTTTTTPVRSGSARTVIAMVHIGPLALLQNIF